MRCRKKLWARVDNVSVFLVDGECVRDKIDIDMVLGGNPGRYKFVPKNEAWIDAVQTPRDRVATALHELVEYSLMRRKRLSYARAHELANRVERKARRGRLDKRSLPRLYASASK